MVLEFHESHINCLQKLHEARHRTSVNKFKNFNSVEVRCLIWSIYFNIMLYLYFIYFILNYFVLYLKLSLFLKNLVYKTPYRMFMKHNSINLT